MSRPTAGAWEDLEHLARYSLGRPSVVLPFNQQVMPDTLRTIVDSDHAADRLTRRSTTGMVQRLGSHTIKTTSNLQAPIGLNLSEAEFYALVHGSCHALGIQPHLRDLSINVDITIESDNNTGKAVASRQGLGKQRHVQARYRWIQHQVAAGAITILKIMTDHNVSDILTKVMPNAAIFKHMTTMGCRDEINLSKLHNNPQSD